MLIPSAQESPQHTPDVDSRDLFWDLFPGRIGKRWSPVDLQKIIQYISVMGARISCEMAAEI